MKELLGEKYSAKDVRGIGCLWYSDYQLNVSVECFSRLTPPIDFDVNNIRKIQLIIK